ERAGHRGQREEPPAAEPDRADHDGEPDDRDEDPGPEGLHSAYRPPKRRRRPAAPFVGADAARLPPAKTASPAGRGAACRRRPQEARPCRASVCDDRSTGPDHVSPLPPAKTASPAGVGVQGVVELALAEVGPQAVDEDELGVGELPEEEVRDPELA